jgi:hypothetical protein
MAERNISIRPSEIFSWQELADAIEKANFAQEERR